MTRRSPGPRVGPPRLMRSRTTHRPAHRRDESTPDASQRIGDAAPHLRSSHAARRTFRGSLTGRPKVTFGSSASHDRMPICPVQRKQRRRGHDNGSRCRGISIGLPVPRLLHGRGTTAAADRRPGTGTVGAHQSACHPAHRALLRRGLRSSAELAEALDQGRDQHRTRFVIHGRAGRDATWTLGGGHSRGAATFPCTALPELAHHLVNF